MEVRCPAHSHSGGDCLICILGKEVEKRVIEAIARERERCAKIAEETALNWSANNDDYKTVALLVAQNIRESAATK